MSVGGEHRDVILSYERVSISYSGDEKRAVISSFSFEVFKGEFLAIVGPSGCGKSSLLHATAGFLAPVSGMIRLGSEVISGPSTRVGFISQRSSLFPWLSVADNIAFGLRVQERNSAETAGVVDELLRTIGLSEDRFKYPEQLSGGMQQRVALARALAPDPQTLLLDEPFSALDTDIRQRMRLLLLQLWNVRGTTVLFVTHDIEEALLLADRVLMLDVKQSEPKLVEVPYPRPRSQDLVHTPEFQDLHQTIAAHYRTSGSPLSQ